MENSALASRGPESLRVTRKNNGSWCDHCKRANHSTRRCWVVHDRPPNRKQWTRNDGRPNPVYCEENQSRNPTGFQSTTEVGPKISENVSLSLTKAQLEQLYKLITPTPSGQSSSGLLTEKGSFVSALTNRSNYEHWVIDSGATDHMTRCKKLFHFYSPCPGHFKIKIANGSLAAVAGMGSIRLSTYVELKSVLHVLLATFFLLAD